MQSKKVFLAQDAFIAFVDRAHPKHLHAGAFFRYFAQEQFMLYTNVSTISLVHQTISKKISPSIGKDFIKALSLSNINILYPEEADLRLSFKSFLGSTSPDISLEEVLMSTMAQRRSIPSICTFEYLHPLFGLSTFYLPV